MKYLSSEQHTQASISTEVSILYLGIRRPRCTCPTSKTPLPPPHHSLTLHWPRSPLRSTFQFSCGSESFSPKCVFALLIPHPNQPTVLSLSKVPVRVFLFSHLLTMASLWSPFPSVSLGLNDHHLCRRTVSPSFFLR